MDEETLELPEQEPSNIEAIEKIVDAMGEEALTPEELALYKQWHPDKSNPEAEHYANLAEHLDDTALNKLATEVIRWVETDIESRKDWETRESRGIRMLGVSDKTDGGAGFEGASDVVHPLLAEAVTQFHSRAIVEMWPPEGPVKTKVLGDATPERSAQSERVSDYMNYLYTTKMPGAFEEEDRMLFRLPLSGSVFKKCYKDPLAKCIVARMVEPSDFIVPYAATDLQTAPRFTHRFMMAHNDVLKNIASGHYADVFMGHAVSDISDSSQVKIEIDSTEGRSNQRSDEYASHEMYEMYLDYDLPGFEDSKDGKQTGIGLPYIVTVSKDEQKVLRIQRNWKPEDKERTKRIYFTHYRFSPGLGFYGYGLLHLIGGLSSAATGVLRSLLDAAAFANLQGGYRTDEGKTEGGDTPIKPGEWRRTKSSFEELKKGFFPLPYKEPSQTLFNLLGYLDERGQRFASTTENMVGEASNTAPVGTTLALIEQGSKAFTAIHKRLHQAHDQEFKLVGDLNYEYLPDEGYPYDVVGASKLIMRSDFDGRVDIIPVSDPAIISSTQRIAQSQAILDMAVKFPDKINVDKAIERMMQAMRIPDYEELLMPAQGTQQPDPLTEAKVRLTDAQAEKVKADTANQKVTAMFGASNVAEKFVTLPPDAAMIYANVTDSVYQAAGGTDANGYPLIPETNNQLAINDSTPENTSPNFPPRPDNGINQGIETGNVMQTEEAM